MNYQQIYLPISILFVAGFVGKTWYDASSSNPVTENVVQTYVIEENPPAQTARPIESFSAQNATPVKGAEQHSMNPPRAQTPQSSSNNVSPSDIDSTSPPVADPVTTPQAEDESLQEMINALDAAFHAQSTDESWSLNSSNQIYAYFDLMSQEESNFASELRSVECRSSLCKVEVLHDSAVAADEFFLRFPGSVGGALPSISYQFENMPDGRINVLMFLASAAEKAR